MSLFEKKSRRHCCKTLLHLTLRLGMYMYRFTLVYVYIYIYIYIYICRHLERGATRLQRICCILYPLSYVSLHSHPSIPASCMLQVVSCILDPPSGIEECGLGTGVLPPTPSDPRILGRPKAASPPAASQPPASQPASQHPAASSQDRGQRQG